MSEKQTINIGYIITNQDVLFSSFVYMVYLGKSIHHDLFFDNGDNTVGYIHLKYNSDEKTYNLIYENKGERSIVLSLYLPKANKDVAKVVLKEQINTFLKQIELCIAK